MWWKKHRHRVVFGTVGVVLVVLLYSLDTGESREYCLLCGKDRCTVYVSVPHLVIHRQELPTQYSLALEPLVHGGGVPHEWSRVYEMSVFRTWQIRVHELLWRYNFHFSVDQWRGRTGDRIEATAFCDPELAIAAGQFFLAYAGRWSESEAEQEKADLLWHTLFIDAAAPHRLELWNETRSLLGLPPISEADYRERVELARAEGDRWQQVLEERRRERLGIR